MPPSDHGPPDRPMVALIIVVVIIGVIVASWRNRRAQDGRAENHDSAAFTWRGRFKATRVP